MRLEKRNRTLKQIDIFLIKCPDTVTSINIPEFTFITFTCNHFYTNYFLSLHVYIYYIFAYTWNKIEKKNKLEDRKKNRTLYHWRPETGIHSEEKQLCLRRIKARGTPVKRLFTTLLKQLSLSIVLFANVHPTIRKNDLVHAKTWNNIWLVTRVYTSRHYVRYSAFCISPRYFIMGLPIKVPLVRPRLFCIISVQDTRV